jgi:hypothetical protein
MQRIKMDSKGLESLGYPDGPRDERLGEGGIGIKSGLYGKSRQ